MGIHTLHPLVNSFICLVAAFLSAVTAKQLLDEGNFVNTKSKFLIQLRKWIFGYRAVEMANIAPASSGRPDSYKHTMQDLGGSSFTPSPQTATTNHVPSIPKLDGIRKNEIKKYLTLESKTAFGERCRLLQQSLGISLPVEFETSEFNEILNNLTIIACDKNKNWQERFEALMKMKQLYYNYDESYKEYTKTIFEQAAKEFRNDFGSHEMISSSNNELNESPEISLPLFSYILKESFCDENDKSEAHFCKDGSRRKNYHDT